MEIRPIKTHPVKASDTDLFVFLDEFVLSFDDQSILVVTSKIISLIQGRVVKIGEREKLDLIRQESEYYLDPEESKYNFSIAIKDGILIPSAGIDESNADGYYVLWPENLQHIVNRVREYLIKKFNIQYAGVIVTDSTTRPMRWGTTGVGLAYSGFEAMKDYVGHEDLFGREMEVTKANLLDGLAAAAVVAMGEGSEGTPLAVISDIPMVKFVDRNPTDFEVKSMKISMKEDLFEKLLTSVEWKKGKRLRAKRL